MLSGVIPDQDFIVRIMLIFFGDKTNLKLFTTSVLCLILHSCDKIPKLKEISSYSNQCDKILLNKMVPGLDTNVLPFCYVNAFGLINLFLKKIRVHNSLSSLGEKGRD